ncbi:MAG: SusC/RagA family TonB-linked outer membrane protein [Chitinophagaceae bacterium]
MSFRKNSRFWVMWILLFVFHSAVAQQQVTVQGTVADSVGGLPNVSIAVSGKTQKFVTDELGRFKASVASDAILEFTFTGYQKEIVALSGKKVSNGVIELAVRMLPLNSDLGEVTVIGFGGTQKKSSLVSSITTVSVKDLTGPTGNLTNQLAGRVAGMISFQQSGEPGRGTDNSAFYIRGLSTFGSGKQDPLILIDGIESSPTDMARIQPDDISDFSVLKDAAAASVYGARGANGVILINTKTGKEGAAKFFLRTENRMSSNTKNFDLADNITYMRLSNEAALTRSPNAILPYSPNKINHTIAGDDPYLYPNNNWIDQLIRKNTLNQNYYLSVNGGTPRARFHVAGSYGRDNGVLKVDPINDFNNNIKLSKYSLRSTVNLNLRGGAELMIRLYGQFDDYSGPIGGGGLIFDYARRSNPVMFPALYPREKRPYVDHPLFGSARTQANGTLTSTLYVNPYAEMVKGYSVYKTSNIQPQLEFKQDLNFLTKGLTFRTMGYLRRYSYFSVNRAYNPFYYNSVVGEDGQSYEISVLNDGSSTSIGTAGTEYLGYAEGGKELDSRLWLEATLTYNRLFGEKHRIGGNLITYFSSYETGNAGSVSASLPSRNNGLSGRFTYGYDDRYLAEFNFGYNGSERFDARNRFGFFPSAGIGYKISNERFFDPLAHIITDLKFRATYGVVGNDQIGNVNDRFFYLSNVNLNDGGFGASFGRNDGTAVYYRPGVSISRYANAGITWEQSRQLNLGMDLKLFNSLDLIVDVFKQKRSQILLPKTYVESALGLMATPYANYGRSETKGVDLSASYQKSFSKHLHGNLRGTFTYATSKRVTVDELLYDESLAHLRTAGSNISQAWGYIAERLFIDEKEVANSPTQFNDPGLMAGDIKYRDINGDGVITSDDRVAIGYPQQPEIIYGFGASMSYKKLDFSFYFQGSARSSFFINPAAIQPFFQEGGFQNGLLNVIANDHWSEDNRNLYAFWPRLSTWRVNPNNQTSTWWMRNGDFLRLKSVDLGYTFGKIPAVGISGVRTYLSATNLFILSDFKLWDVEMGGNGLGYPIQSVYSIGVEVNF